MLARPAPPPPDPRQLLLDSAAAAFAKRDALEALQRALHDWRDAAALKDDAAIHVSLARAENFLARRIPRKGGRAAKREAFTRGADEARRALLLLGVDDALPCPAAIPPDQLDAWLWRAENLEGLGRELGLVEGAKARAEARCLAERLVAVVPKHHQGEPERILARLLVQLPALGGGDLERARRVFTDALAASPANLQVRVDYAFAWAVKKQDLKSFSETLEAVLVSPTDLDPELGPENRLAREEARALLERRKELF